MELNPDSPMLEQMREEWQRIVALLVWKYGDGKKGVTLTAEDMQNAQDFFDEGHRLLAHGHVDSIELRFVSAEEAAAIAEYQEGFVGNA